MENTTTATSDLQNATGVPVRDLPPSAAGGNSSGEEPRRATASALTDPVGKT